MEQPNQRPRRVLQALQVVEKDDSNAELRITTDDEASSLLWAAQWLDEHREYSAVAIRLDPRADPDDDEDRTTQLVIDINRWTDRAPRRFGPWAQGVPTLFNAPRHNPVESPQQTRVLEELTAALERVAMHLGDR